MRHTGPLLCLAASIVHAASDSARPRGVGPDFAKFYKNSETFTCISNPSVKLPFSRVNDDFCDCPDGSDEPGTAACASLSPLSPPSPADSSIADTINATLALPGFYCKNKGHTPSYIPFTAVNDGICDYDLCCDGSDEFGGLVKCTDKCDSIGKEFRKHAEARQKTLNAARAKRRELVTEAARLRKEVEDEIKNLETQITAAEVTVKQSQDTLKDVEKRERGRMAKGNSGKAGEVAILVGQAKQRTQELRDNLIRVREERETAKTRLEELEQLLSTFKVEYNPNFNDEGVKRAVRAWEDYSARDKSAISDAAHDRDLDEITKTDEEAGLNWDSFLSSSEPENPELDLLYSFEAYLPAPLRDWLDHQLRTLRQSLIDNGILAQPHDTPAPTESKAVTDARNAVQTAENSLSSLRTNLDNHRSDLTKDYGQDDVFRPLAKQCITQDSGEYTYEMCYLGSTTQKPKKGGGNTGMGNFASLEVVDVDDEVRADGKGLGSGKRLAMKFENGQHCWNGPNRSTMVIMACAEKGEIWKVTEEEKCVYRMEVGTPAVCGWEAERKGEEGVPRRDEL
ncbi:Glucosidase 2 subunit beta [Sphaceloma murrayae]|uniref:Glucosidase 2 subunit beta n=1 Tax=Sphaceloma murrayae TaxID=2082308 RepID=A0A2K1QLS0_9PEZI|nr:Glucosidase 2 subunit beta [Sphaceloma murrayae]